MPHSRRQFLTSGSAVTLLTLMAASGLLGRQAAAAQWNKGAFESKSIDELVRTLGGTAPQLTDDIEFVGPEIAENGAVVPVEITSRIPGTDSIALLIEKNPNLLAASFTIPAGTLPEIQTRVKMAETCDVYALVRAQGKFYYTAKQIKVTVGGCGG